MPQSRRLGILAVVGLSVTLALGHRRATAEGREPLAAVPAVVQLAVAKTVSDQFHREARRVVESVPEHIWRTIESAGWRVQLAEFVVDVTPSLRGVQPRGWPLNWTWDNSDAIHLPSAKLLIVAEKRRNSLGEIVSSNRIAEVFLHELGHAFDMAAGRPQRLSAAAEFIEAYRRDVQQLSAEQRDQLAYYLQGNPAGGRETFAEAFAVALAGPATSHASQDFAAAFPRVVAHLQALLERPASTP